MSEPRDPTIYETAVNDFICQRIGDHIKVLSAPERIVISADLCRDSEIIERFILLPGGFLYRIEGETEGGGLEGLAYEAFRVEKPSHRFKWK